MTTEQFRNYCEEILYDEADESWASGEKLRGIAIAISNVALDFDSDVAMQPEFGEQVLDV